MNDIKRLREALEDSNELLEELARLGEWWDAAKCQIKDNKEALATLAAPPRNCDRFANEAEARKAFIVWYNTVYELWGDKWNEVESCDLKHNVNDILQDYIEWLFSQAEEQKGSNNGSK